VRLLRCRRTRTDAGIYVWHRETAALIEVLASHESGSVNAVAWNTGSSSALFASGGDDRTVRLWRPGPAASDESTAMV
jgi:WD40 repeat protein